MNNIDDHVLDLIVRFLPSKTRASLACVSRRHRQAVHRVLHMYGTGLHVTQETYHQKIRWIRSHARYIRSCVCSKVPLYRLPVDAMNNLRRLKLWRVEVNIREILLLKDMALDVLDVSRVTRSYYQIDRFKISLLRHINAVSLCFDDSWNAVVFDDVGVITSLQIRCRLGTWYRQPFVCVETVGHIKHLSLSCYNRPYIAQDVDPKHMETVYVHCPKSMHLRTLCRLMGPKTTTLTLSVPRATTLSSGDLCARAPRLKRLRVHAASYIHDARPESVQFMVVYADTCTMHPYITKPDVLICPQVYSAA